MRKLRFALAVLFALSAVPLHLAAQDSTKTDGKKAPVTLKVQVTFAETDGEKKLANLPYMFFLKAVDNGPGPAAWAKLRIGSRVPVYVGKENGMQYVDVGTSIDGRGFIRYDGRFDLSFSFERSWLEGDVVVPIEKPSSPPSDPTTGHFREPIFRQFKTELPFTMRDGETVQTTQAADPLSGRVLTITVTINAVK